LGWLLAKDAAAKVFKDTAWFQDAREQQLRQKAMHYGAFWNTLQTKLMHHRLNPVPVRPVAQTAPGTEHSGRQRQTPRRCTTQQRYWSGAHLALNPEAVQHRVSTHESKRSRWGHVDIIVLACQRHDEQSALAIFREPLASSYPLNPR
jgi:hypothetical protein